MSFIEFLKIFKLCLHYLGITTLYMYTFWSVFTLIGFFATRKFPKAKNNHKYAVMIAARNEEPVIGNLIDSIKRQDYPSELVTVFVVADNCTDKTAEIARSHGAVCYERFDSEHKTKGYALEFLVDNIKRDYTIESFDAYFIFDADNLLKKDYIKRMNEAFDSGEKIVTSYRNTKNFDANWIAAGYGIHWLRTVRHEHRARSVLNLATRIQGTGFMFASEIIKDGWHYVSFTEDRAFAADSVVRGYRISYCDVAEFYDEQPTSLKIAFRQRIRWGKGHLQAFAELAPKLLLHVFSPNKVQPVINTDNIENETTSHIDNTTGDIKRDIHDLLLHLMHYRADSASKKLMLPLVWIGTGLCAVLYFLSFIGCKITDFIGDLLCMIKRTRAFKAFVHNKIFKSIKMRFMSYDMFLITFPNNIVSLLRRWLNVFANIALRIAAAEYLSAFINPLFAYFLTFAERYYGNIFFSIYVFFAERKRIIKISFWKKAFYCFMWPMFDIIGSITVLIALFSHVEWKPIPHNTDISIDSLDSNLSSKK